MGLIEETNELMLDWNKLSDMSRENHVIPVAVQNMDTKEVILIAYINSGSRGRSRATPLLSTGYL